VKQVSESPWPEGEFLPRLLRIRQVWHDRGWNQKVKTLQQVIELLGFSDV